MIILSEQPFLPWQMLHDFQAEHGELKGETGAQETFIGYMRHHNEGDKVASMSLEHYPAMTEKSLNRIEQAARDQWKLLDVLVVHRFGDIVIGDAIVLISCWSAHRGDAMAATRFIIEKLKHEAPFWKKEHTDQGERWVESNTPTNE